MIAVLINVKPTLSVNVRVPESVLGNVLLAEYVCVCVWECVCLRMCIPVCVCVCVWERERESEICCCGICSSRIEKASPSVPGDHRKALVIVVDQTTVLR